MYVRSISMSIRGCGREENSSATARDRTTHATVAFPRVTPTCSQAQLATQKAKVGNQPVRRPSSPSCQPTSAGSSSNVATKARGGAAVRVHAHSRGGIPLDAEDALRRATSPCPGRMTQAQVPKPNAACWSCMHAQVVIAHAPRTMHHAVHCRCFWVACMHSSVQAAACTGMADRGGDGGLP